MVQVNTSNTTPLFSSTSSLLTGFTLGNTIGPALFTVASYAPIYVLSIILVLTGVMSIPIFVKGGARKLAKDAGAAIVVVEETSDGYTKTRLWVSQ